MKAEMWRCYCAPLIKPWSTMPLRRTGSGNIAQAFLTSTTVGSEWLASSQGLFIPKEATISANWIGDSIETMTVWTLRNRENSLPCWELNPVVETAEYRYTDWAMPALWSKITKPNSTWTSLTKPYIICASRALTRKWILSCMCRLMRSYMQ